MTFRPTKGLCYSVYWVHAVFVRHERYVISRTIHGTSSKSLRNENWNQNQNQIQPCRTRGEWRDSWKLCEHEHLDSNYDSSPSPRLHVSLQQGVPNLSRFSTGWDHQRAAHSSSCLTASFINEKCLWFQPKREPVSASEGASPCVLYCLHRNCDRCVKFSLTQPQQAIFAHQSHPQTHLLQLQLHSAQRKQLHTCSTPHHHHTGTLRQFHTFVWRFCRQDAQLCYSQFHCQTQQQQAVRYLSGFSNFTSRQRIPLGYTDDINQVLDDYGDVIQEFAQVMDCSEAEVKDMVRRDTRLVTLYSKHEVILKMRLLLEHGFESSQIMKKYQLFSRSLPHIQSCLVAMEPVKHYRHPLSMLLLNGAHFRSRLAAYQREVSVMGPHHANQASFVAELLRCSQEELAALIQEKKSNFLLTLSPSRLKEVVGLLTSFGVSIDMIHEHPGMLRCPPGVAMERLQRAQGEGVLKLRLIPYILTNSDAHVDATFVYWRRNAQALQGYSDERQLLLERLECSEKELEGLLRRKPLVRSMASSKLKDCLDVLLEEIGLAPEAVLCHGDLLHFSPRRLRGRWALLQPLGLPESLLVKDLILPEKKFMAKYGFGSY